MKRILIVKTTSMGDVIHALPVLSDIHRYDPTILIDWMVEEPFADLVKSNSLVNQVVVVNLRRWRRQGLFHVHQEWKKLKASLEDRQYDLVIDLQGLLKSAYLACAANGPRAGASFGMVKEWAASFFYSQRAGWDSESHAVERLRVLAAHLMGYSLQGPPIFYPDMAPRSVSNESNRVIWFLHATARDEKKWPIVSWRELAHRFSDLGYSIKLPWGTDLERQQAEAIASGIERVEVLPRMSLAILRTKMHQASLVIGVDTGLTHLAAALYLPMVALFFATPAWRFSPRFNPHSISLGDVGVVPKASEVFEASTRLLRGVR